MTRVIRQKNGMDTLYTLHTSRGSGDAVLTNEKLPRVASRGRELAIWLQNPFRGLSPSSKAVPRVSGTGEHVSRFYGG